MKIIFSNDRSNRAVRRRRGSPDRSVGEEQRLPMIQGDQVAGPPPRPLIQIEEASSFPAAVAVRSPRGSSKNKEQSGHFSH